VISMKVAGGKELAAILDALPAKVSTGLLLDGLTAAAEPIRRSMGAKAARSADAPHIADNIVISRVRSSEAQAAVAVGPSREFPYGVPLEVGTVDTAAQPFARPAYDENIEASTKIMTDVIWRELTGKGLARRPSESSPVAVQAPRGTGLL
jgi:HK97 gp10 family phage protein